MCMQMFNFVVLGVDSVSRLNFARHMSLTRHFLVDELGAVELGGFNKVNNCVSALAENTLVFLSRLWCACARVSK